MVWILVAVVSVWLVHRGLSRTRAEDRLGRPLGALGVTTLLVRIAAADRAPFERLTGALSVEEPGFATALLGRLAGLEAMEERWQPLHVGRGAVGSDGGARARADAWIDAVRAATEGSPEAYRDRPASGGELVLALAVVAAEVSAPDARRALKHLKVEALRSATRFRCVIVPSTHALTEADLTALIPRVPTI